MVRPRLVQEGVPIGTENETQCEVSHHGVDDHEMEHEGTHASTQPHGGTAAKPKSSLLQAVGGKLPQRQQKSRSNQNTMIIGGASPSEHFHVQGGQHGQHSISSTTPFSFPTHHPATTHATQFTIGGNSQSSQDHAHHHAQPMDHHLAYASSSTTAYHHSQQYQIPHSCSSTTTIPTTAIRSHPHHHLRAAAHRTHYEIGADERPTERMEGVEDHSIKPPLVVLDGANVAYAYGGAMHGSISSTPVPDARGISVACQYFAKAGLRVLVVLPASWFRNFKRPQTTDDGELQQVVQELEQGGFLVPSPPTDDDDAYALTIAQRENARSLRNPLHGPGYVLSNDLFRDAQNRDASGQLREWLNKGNPMKPEGNTSSLSKAVQEHNPHGPGRISYTFCDMGAKDDYGDRMLDFVPNPRHPLVSWVESNIHHAPHHRHV